MNRDKQKKENELMETKVLRLVKGALSEENAVATHEVVGKLFNVKATAPNYGRYAKVVEYALKRLRKKGHLFWTYNRNGLSLIFQPITPLEIKEQMFRYKALVKSNNKMIRVLQGRLKKVK